MGKEGINKVKRSLSFLNICVKECVAHNGGLSILYNDGIQHQVLYEQNVTTSMF